MESTCCDCRRTRPFDAFHRDKPRRDGTPRVSRRCKECQSAYLKAWKARNPERLAETKARYYRANRAQQQAWGANHRAQGAGGGGRMTPSEREAILRSFDGRCAYCGAGGATTFDHMIPICRGGQNVSENVVLACASCNAAKGSLTPLEWFLARPDAHGRRQCRSCREPRGATELRGAICLDCVNRKARERWHAMSREERTAWHRRYRENGRAAH